MVVYMKPRTATAVLPTTRQISLTNIYGREQWHENT